MENATKALLMAGGVLIAILIITIFIAVLQSTGGVSKRYKESISSEQITTFNSNFTKYLGQDLTIHEVVTICNFAKDNNIHIVNSIINGKTEADILDDINTPNKITYKLRILEYNTNGFIDKIKFDK